MQFPSMIHLKISTFNPIFDVCFSHVTQFWKSIHQTISIDLPSFNSLTLKWFFVMYKFLSMKIPQHCYLVCNAFAWRWRRHFNYTGFSAQNQCNCVWRCVVNVVQICILSTNLCNSSRPFNFSSASRRLESHKFQMSFLTKNWKVQYMSLVNGQYSTGFTETVLC